MPDIITLRHQKLWARYTNIWLHGIYNYDVGFRNSQRNKHGGTTSRANRYSGLFMKCESE